MKDDTISRQAAIETVWKITKKVPTMAIRARDALKTIPSAQLEIIKCKDCGHADWSGLPEGMLYCMVHEHYLSEDDYCSYGVKEDG